MDQIVIGHKDGQVKIYDTLQNKYVKTVMPIMPFSIVGLGYVNNILVFGTHNGVVNLWKSDKHSDKFVLGLGEDSTLDSLVCHKTRKNVIGTGGESNDFKLWDVETKQCIFRAKSVRVIIIIICFYIKVIVAWSR